MGIKVIYTNDNGGQLEFSDETGLYITSFDSLSQNGVSFTESTAYDQIGTLLSNTSVNARTFTIEGRFKKDPDVRRKLIETIIPGIGATVRYIDENNDIDVYWTGQPEKTPDIGWTYYWQSFQFTFKAFYPYAVETSGVVDPYLNKTALFKFPATFNSKKSGASGFYFSTSTQYRSYTIYSNSTVDYGMVFRAEVKVDTLDQLTVEKMDTFDGLTLINLSEIPIKQGDIIEFSTVSGDVYVRLLKQGSEVGAAGTNLLKYVAPGSTFLHITPGKQVIQYMATDTSGQLLDLSSCEAVLMYNKVVLGV